MELSGEVRNFLPMDLLIVDADGQVRTTFPSLGPAYIRWVPKEICWKYVRPTYRPSAESLQLKGWQKDTTCAKHPPAELPSEEQLQDQSWRQDLVEVKDYHPDMVAAEDVVGQLNGFIDLVSPRPDENIASLLDFWRKAKALQYARVEDLPDLKALRKRCASQTYCVVTRGAAMLAYLSYQEAEHLLIPALPVVLPDKRVGYRALMPMQLVLEHLR